MSTTANTPITVETTLNAPIEKIWECWTLPRHIIKWNQASPEWHTTKAENNLKTGGKFISRMEAKDGSMAFDFEGIYDLVLDKKLIEYTMPDGRKVKVAFNEQFNKVHISETFQPESTNSLELQRAGWQAILDNFKNYVEHEVGR
ncbi:MAG: polyketide cyclase [Cyclobacteriaceae bacterium]|nr:polyketide cyclase [Cyclobacteriaceae bacterium]